MDSRLLKRRAFHFQGGHVDQDKPEELQACEEKVEELAAENAELRESAESFGALAERLNQARLAEPAAAAVACPRCGKPQHVTRTAPTLRGHDLHCEYCGHSWGSQATADNRAEAG